MFLMLIQFTEPLPVFQHLSLSSNLKHHGISDVPPAELEEGKDSLYFVSFAVVELQRKTI